MSSIKMELADTKTVYFGGKTFSYKDMIKAIPGTAWNKSKKRWEMPIESVADALRILPNLPMTPELRDAFRNMTERNQAAVAIKTIDQSTLDGKVKGLKGTLYPYQAVGLEFLKVLEDGEGDVLGYDMGLGKSILSLAYGLHLKNEGIIDHILVVCPSKLKYATWEKEVKKWTDLSYIVIDGEGSETVEWDDGTVEKLTGRPLREVQYQQYLEGTEVLIMNYELFQYDLEQEGAVSWVKEYTLKKADRDELADFYEQWMMENGEHLDTEDAWKRMSVDFLDDRGYDTDIYELRSPKRPYIARKEDASYRIIPPIDGRWLVILDEAHRIKNPKAVTTKNLVKVVREAGRKVLGTGTPLENNIEEMWTLADLCRKGILGTFWAFQNRYMEKDYWGSTIAPKVHMLPELMEKLDPIMIRMTKEEALPDLPPLTVINHPVGMTPFQEKLYKQVKEGIIEMAKEDEFTYLEALAQITRLQQVCDSPALLRTLLDDPNLPIESGKLLELEFILSEVNPSKNKFILFSKYSEMTDIVHDWLIEKSILRKEQIGYVKGGIAARRIEDVRKGFQEGDIQCVLMTTAGNYGLDLYEASYVICIDTLFNPQKMNQIYSRAHRNGATKPITAINLVTVDSYEVKMQEILEAKSDLFKAVIDGEDLALKKLFSKPEDLLDII